MPDLFSPLTVKDVTLRNRIGMSPMTMYRSTDGRMDDFHVMHLGARAAGGFGLVFAEQLAISPDARTGTACGGVYDDAQVEGLRRITGMVGRMGAVPAVQLGHTGRKGSRLRPWEGGTMLEPHEPGGWQTLAPSAVAYGGKRKRDVLPRELTVEEIAGIHRDYAAAAARALEAGFRWLEVHFAHGYLGASFFSPLANRRTDAYGGSLENRARFLLETLEAVRAVWPEHLPLSMRLGVDDFHPDGICLEEAVTAIGWMRERGIDLADVSIGSNTDDMVDPPLGEPGAMLEAAARVRREVGLPVATSWNLGRPEVADAAVRDEQVDLVLLGRAALANPHWPVWAARELGHEDPWGLLPDDYAWWLRNFRGDPASVGWPLPAGASAGAH